MDDSRKMEDDLVHLARLALAGRPQDIHLLLRRMVRRYKTSLPQLSEELKLLLRQAPTRQSPLKRQSAAPLPVDSDSRLELLRYEHVTELDVDPILGDDLWDKLNQVLSERQSSDRLAEAGLAPTKSALFTGAPGVGKSLCARWLAKELKVPLLILDLSAVMSSFLGKTGNNLRNVLDYAKGMDCILLLDELDAVAKRRDDSTEIGELKRLVTVLLQEIDDWPPTGLLIAATNHPDLLDPAVWRRFELLVEFPMPDHKQACAAIRQFLELEPDDDSSWDEVLAMCLEGLSYSDIRREMVNARRNALIRGCENDAFLSDVIHAHIGALPREGRIRVASRMVEAGIVSQRQAHDLTGVSRDTIRKSINRREQDVA